MALNGRHFDLSTWRGRVVIVNLWAAWCTPCRAEMPMLDRFARAHRDLVVIGVAQDRPRDEDEVRRLAATVSYPIAALSGLTDGNLGRPHILPVTYVIGPDGTIRAVFRSSESALTEEQLAAAAAKARKTN